MTIDVRCNEPKCPRHYPEFNPQFRCSAEPPTGWPAIEDRAWYKRGIATPRARAGYGMGSVQPSDERWRRRTA
ncbi:MAG TPA: hypothetical protein VE338_06825 [Ktedonobacterales bacterium]|nr:hypothetical protein [Ktedonobacterales bacterium]